MMPLLELNDKILESTLDEILESTNKGLNDGSWVKWAGWCEVCLPKPSTQFFGFGPFLSLQNAAMSPAT
jgi:hypothetical protein